MKKTFDYYLVNAKVSCSFICWNMSVVTLVIFRNACSHLLSYRKTLTQTKMENINICERALKEKTFENIIMGIKFV